MTREEYHVECLSDAISNAGFHGVIPVDKIKEVTEEFVAGLEMESEAFGDLCIPNPETLEIQSLKDKLKKKEDNFENIERAWFKKACELRGVNPEFYVPYRDGIKIEIMERR